MSASGNGRSGYTPLSFGPGSAQDIPIRAMEETPQIVSLPLRKGKNNVVLHQVWGAERPLSQANGKTLLPPGFAKSQKHKSKTMRASNSTSTLLADKKKQQNIISGANAVEDLNQRLDRMKARVAQSLKGHHRGKIERPKSSTPSPYKVGTAGSNKYFKQPFQRNHSAITTYGDLDLPNQPELQKWVESYQVEKTEYASFALHAEMHLQRLELIGTVPNRLALAVCMDILGQLPDVIGRYAPIVSKVHEVLFSSSYLPRDVALDSMESTKEAGIPTTLAGFYNQDCYFIQYQQIQRHSEQLMDAVKQLGVQARATLQFMDASELQILVRDVLFGSTVFTQSIRTNAVHGLRAKEASEIVTNALALSRGVHTSNQTVGLFLSLLRNLKETERNMVYEALLEDADGKGILSWVMEEADDIVKEELMVALKAAPVELENGEILQKRPKSRPELTTVTGLTSVVDSFLSSATEKDVEILRKIIMKADEEHGVQWKLILPWEEEETYDDHTVDYKNMTNAELRALKALKEEERFIQEKDMKTKVHAHNVVSKLRSKVHAGQKRKRKQKKHKITMAKFKTAAKTVMMTTVMTKPSTAGGADLLSVDVSENSIYASFDAAMQCTGPSIDAAIHALEGKSEKFISYCTREKRKLLMAIEGLVAIGFKEKHVTVDHWREVVSDCGILMNQEIESEIFAALGAPGGDGDIHVEEFLAYLDQMKVVDTMHENAIRDKMFGSGDGNGNEWEGALLDMLENATDKAKKKTSKAIYIRVNKSALPPSCTFKLASNRIGAADFVRVSEKTINVMLKSIAELIPEYYRSEILTISESKKKACNLASFVYGNYISQFGLPKIADVNYLGLIVSTLALKSSHKRIAMFARFMLQTDWEEELASYCRAIVHVDQVDKQDQYSPNRQVKTRKTSPNQQSKKKSKKLAALVKSNVVSQKQKSGDIPMKDEWEVRLPTVMKVAGEILKRVSQSQWDNFVEAVERIAAEEKKTPNSSITHLSNAVDIMKTEKTNPPLSPKNTHKTNSTSKSPKKVLSKGRSGSFDASTDASTDGDSPRKSPRKARRESEAGTDRTKTINVDDFLDVLLQTVREDRIKKVEYVVSLFTAVDIDGNGELSFSEFTTLLHSLDPMVDHKHALSMYMDALAGEDEQEMTTASFVKAIQDHGLLHLAGENASKLNSILNSMEDLRAIWKETKPFVEGILSCLERDLDEDSELFTYRESGDQSLRGIHERILNFEKLMLEGMQEVQAWQSYWIIVREVWEAACQGPGIQSIYPLDVTNEVRTTRTVGHAVDRNTKDTATEQRKRRVSLTHIMFPQNERVCVDMPSTKPIFTSDNHSARVEIVLAEDLEDIESETSDEDEHE